MDGNRWPWESANGMSVSFRCRLLEQDTEIGIVKEIHCSLFNGLSPSINRHHYIIGRGIQAFHSMKPKGWEI